MTEVFTFGEAMLRLSVSPGHTLETAPAYAVHVAGTEANVAATLSRLDREVSWVSALPEGPLGRRVLAELQACGVDCSGVVVRPEGRIGTYFVELHAEPLAARVIYDRAGSAAAGFTLGDVPWELFESAQIIHMTGITPALSASCREVVLDMAERARRDGKFLSVDVNYRSKLWGTEEASRVISEVMRSADLVVCTGEDASDLFGISLDPPDVARELADRHAIARVVVTSGVGGAWWCHDGNAGHVSAISVSVVDRIGAGDAFMAGVLDGILDGDLGLGVRRGNALAALALTTRGDRAVASRAEVDSMLTGAARRVDR